MKILFCSKMVKCKVRVVRNGKCVTITNPTYHHCGPFILTPSKIFQILLIIQNTFLPWRYLCYFRTIELVVFIFVSAEIIGHLWAIIGLHEIINVALICSYHKPPPSPALTTGGSTDSRNFKYICLTLHSLHSKWTIFKANKRREPGGEVGGGTGECLHFKYKKQFSSIRHFSFSFLVIARRSRTGIKTKGLDLL